MNDIVAQYEGLSLNSLTEIEKEVIHALALGFSTKEIAIKRGKNPSTITMQTNSAMHKLGLQRSQLSGLLVYLYLKENT